MLKLFAQYIYYPLIIGLVWSAFFYFHQVYPQLNLHNLAYTIGFCGVMVVWISEYLLTYRNSWLLNHDDFWTDLISTNIMLPVLSKLAEMFIFLLFSFYVSDHLKTSLQLFWPKHLPILIQLLFMLLISEFLFYWYHRFAHKVVSLWHFHAIHHSVKRVYWNNSGRFHPFDLFFNWFIYFSPLFLFSVSEELIALFLITNAITGLLEHSNIDFKLGFLNRIFNSAELHRWHHSLETKESNSNFGKVLSFWDQVFGTYNYNNQKEVGEVGVRGDNVPLNFWKQLLYPFKAIFRTNR